MRRIWLSLALLALGLAARAAEIRTGPSLSIPPLILGSVAQASHPLWASFDQQVVALKTLPTSQASAYLAQAAQASPLQAMSARALAIAAVEPAAAKALLAAQPDVARAETLGAAIEALKGADGLAALAAEGRADPALARVFDHAAAAPSLELDGIVSKGSSLRLGQEKLGFLGQGEFGAVYEHPSIPGAIVKAVQHGFEVSLFMMNKTITDTANEEETVSRALAAADAGPRYFGRAVVARRELSVRERIYGDTMQQLARDRKFGPEEQALVLDLLRRMAKGRLYTDDKRAPNIMIGRTLLDPRRRAYLIDGGNILPVDAAVSEDELYGNLLHQNTILIRKMDPHMGEIEISRPFSQLMADAVYRSRPTTTWQRFKDGLREAFTYPHVPR
jgi:hypothetical protein